MVQYNFRGITVVPSSKDFIEFTLSKTQRKTPTVIHKREKLSKIRQFYLRKIKFTQQNFHDRLNSIVTQFPKLDEVHPFYTDLMNILYDRDHYKLALGQINTAKNLIDNVARDYTRLIKLGDSLFRCKQLKRAALGRMVTLIRRQKSSLEYLEQVRQHLSRLPTIDPTTRTLIICGYPNVGKSSFLNTITRANVEVQSYAFTTKSLYVGHTDYNYLRWQVIDTPGILDHALEERNTIEMQAVTALAHLKAAILYLVDPSESCGYSLGQQFDLFMNIMPLFTGKPLIVCSNKCDVAPLASLDEEKTAIIERFKTDGGAEIFEMSTLSGEGIEKVKSEACDRLLEMRVEAKLKSKAGNVLLNRVHVAQPVPRDDKLRLPFIPQEFIDSKGSETEKKLERDIELEMGDDYVTDYKKNYDLPDEYKYDIIPEFYNGHNVADFVDLAVFERLSKLNQEEELREQAGFYDPPPSDDEPTKRLKETARRIRSQKRLLIQKGRVKRKIKRKPSRMMHRLQLDNTETRIRRSGESYDPSMFRKLKSSSNIVRHAISRREETNKVAAKPNIGRSLRGLRDDNAVRKVIKMQRQGQRQRALEARKGEGDRHVPNLRPKHLLSGKRKFKANHR